MRTFKKLFSSLLAVLLMMQVFAPMAVSAATESNGYRPQTITVETEAGKVKPYIFFRQTRGMRRYENPYSHRIIDTNTCGTWDVTVIKNTENGKEEIVEETRLYKTSLKIILEPDTKYTIVVRWNKKIDDSWTMFKGSFMKHPTWKVEKSAYLSVCE